jgi:oligopeptide/dipeptide ABC transporter ATP-binding protein
LSVIRGRIPDIIRPPLGCKFHPRCDEIVPACLEGRPELVEMVPGHQVACVRAQR